MLRIFSKLNFIFQINIFEKGEILIVQTILYDDSSENERYPFITEASKCYKFYSGGGLMMKKPGLCLFVLLNVYFSRE